MTNAQLLEKIRKIVSTYHYSKSEINHIRNVLKNKLDTHTHNYLSEDEAVELLIDYGLIRSPFTINNIILTSDKYILSQNNNETAVFSATVFNEDGNVIPNKEVVFYINDNVYDTVTTDNTGIATVSYDAVRAGELNVKAVSEEISSSEISIVDVYESRTLTEVYNNEWRYFHISTHNSTSTISAPDDGDINGVKVSRVVWSGTTGIKLQEFNAGTSFMAQKEFYSYNGVFEGFILTTENATYMICLTQDGNFRGGKTEVSEWNSDNWGNDTAIINYFNALEECDEEREVWATVRAYYNGTDKLTLKYYNSNHVLVGSASIDTDFNTDFTLYSLNAYCGTSDSGCSNVNWNKNIRIMSI